MTNDQASGIWWGLFVGDAMGVPLEFTQPNYGKPVTTFTSGGVHKAAVGEYSDDGISSDERARINDSEGKVKELRD